MNKHINFGKTLKNLRQEKSLTQVQLATLLNVTDSSIRDWENRGKQPSYEVLFKLSQIFEVTIGQLLDVED